MPSYSHGAVLSWLGTVLVWRNCHYRTTEAQAVYELHYKRHFKNPSNKSCGSSLKNDSIKESVTRCFHVYYVLATLDWMCSICEYKDIFLLTANLKNSSWDLRGGVGFSFSYLITSKCKLIYTCLCSYNRSLFCCCFLKKILKPVWKQEPKHTNQNTGFMQRWPSAYILQLSIHEHKSKTSDWSHKCCKINNQDRWWRYNKLESNLPRTTACFGIVLWTLASVFSGRSSSGLRVLS